MLRVLSLFLVLAAAKRSQPTSRQSSGKVANATGTKTRSFSDFKNNASCTELSELLPSFKVVPYSTIGDRWMGDCGHQEGLGDPLDMSMVIVDPTGLKLVEQNNPEGAYDEKATCGNGVFQVSSELYKRLSMFAYPQEVIKGLNGKYSEVPVISNAKLHPYPKMNTNVVHVVAPDLWGWKEKVPWTTVQVDLSKDMGQALMAVQESYKSIFKEFMEVNKRFADQTKFKTLRLHPISFGIHGGPYGSRGHTQLTYVAIVRATNEFLREIHPKERERFKAANIEMCIYKENDFGTYRDEAENACY